MRSWRALSADAELLVLYQKARVKEVLKCFQICHQSYQQKIVCRLMYAMFHDSMYTVYTYMILTYFWAVSSTWCTRSARHFTDALHCQRRSGVIDQDQISSEWQPVTATMQHNWSLCLATITNQTYIENYRQRHGERGTDREAQTKIIWKLTWTS